MTDDTDNQPIPAPESAQPAADDALFTPLPPDASILDVIDNVCRQVQARRGKPCTFVAIPRILALRASAERAEACKKTMLEQHWQALLDGRIKAMLLALSHEGRSLPVVAMEMPAPMVAGWSYALPRYVEAEGFEEHPEYAGVPFSRLLWDKGEAGRIPELCRKALNYCLPLINRKPAEAFQMVQAQARDARPLVMADQGELQQLPDEPEVAIKAFLDGMEERREMIQKALDRDGMFGMEFNGDLPPDVLAAMKAAFAERHNALAEFGPHPVKRGWFALVATPMGLATGE
jgi:hypothetical protein